MNKIGRRARVFLMALTACALGVAVMAQAALAAQDYEAIKTGAIAEVTAALAAAWPVLALIIGVLLGIKLFRRASS